MRLSLERLMAAAGHELKTPTAAIHNYLQLVERRLADGDAARRQPLRRPGDRPGAAARRTGRSAVRRQPDPERPARDRRRPGRPGRDRPRGDGGVVRPSSTRRRSGSPPGPLSLAILGDSGRLEQVFLNLVANAIEHAGGSGSIDVSRPALGRISPSSTCATTGRGIPAEDLPVLFEAYTRVGQPKRATGLGLGLFVAREIVAAHGGSITVTSQIGSGSTFTVRLPARSGLRGVRVEARAAS